MTPKDLDVKTSIWFSHVEIIGDHKGEKLFILNDKVYK